MVNDGSLIYFLLIYDIGLEVHLPRIKSRAIFQPLVGFLPIFYFVRFMQ